MVEKKDKTGTLGGDQLISRKEALIKAGKYAAFTAAAMMAILEPTNAQIPPKSPPKPPGSAPKQKKAKKPRTDPPPSF